MASKRIGCFSLNADLIDDWPEAVQEALGSVIVTRAEMVYHINRIEYTAIGDCFEEVTVGNVTRQYEVMFRSEEIEDADGHTRSVFKFEGFK